METLTEIKSKGIMLKPELINAFIRGDKTQTRRTQGLDEINESPDDWTAVITASMGDYWYTFFQNEKTGKKLHIKFPYGMPGEHVYFKETFKKTDDGILFQADLPESEWKDHKWTSKMFLKKVDARCWAELEGIRMQRLNDISMDDSKAEGISYMKKANRNFFKNYLSDTGEHSYNVKNANMSFYSLWIAINGEDSYKKNPYIWVLDLKKIEK